MTKKPVILAGSGRSGTTWLGNILAANPNVRILFEPFDHRRVPAASLLPLRAYARLGEPKREWEPLMQQVLTGAISNEWVNRQSSPWQRWFSSRLLIKTIRAHLMLGWISQQYGTPIVYVTRHPCAVVHSRLKLGWETHLDVFLSQPCLITDYLAPYLEIIKEAETVVARHAVMWCVENIVPLHQLDRFDWIFCTYEKLYTAPEVEAERILSQLNMQQTIFTRWAIRRVSMVARPDSAIISDDNPLLDWQRHLSPENITTVLDIVAAFGIGLYSAEPMPHLSARRPTLSTLI
jgi:hypothetical protein